MEIKPITIRVNADVARLFESASEEQRHKFEALLIGLTPREEAMGDSKLGLSR